MTKPLVSVCIPTYRGAAFLAATIDSVLRQTYPNFELWILDDNSPDETTDIVAAYIDPRIRYIRHTENLGPQGNWNRCLEVATGEYYKLLPHDDLLMDDCLERQVAVLEADTNQEIALVFGARQIISPDGRVLMSRGLPRATTGRINNIDLIRRAVRSGANPIGEPGNGLFRRGLIDKVGLYDASFPYVVDLDYWFRILQYGDAFYIAEITTAFRISKGSWSVAIGSNQTRDYQAFVDTFYNNPKYQISSTDRLFGFGKSRLNTFMRVIFYWYIF